MKRLFIAIAIVMLMSGVAFADPFLTCDDMQNVDFFIMELDGVEHSPSPAVSGHAWIDMSPVSMGTHTVRLKARNIWGEGPYSLPFVFTKALPGPPSGVGLKVK